MRNVFDQYKDPENRLTHALACCLHEDAGLLQSFIHWSTADRGKRHSGAKVVEQHVPGHPVADFDDDGEHGLPDMWIHDPNDEQWSLVVECKIAAPIDVAQLRRHQRTAKANGFDNITLLVIAPAIPSRRIQAAEYKTWTDVYGWMRRQASASQWAARFVDYIQIAEGKMASDNYLGGRTLTHFDGIPFGEDHPYSYREGKRILKLLMIELRKRGDLRKIGMDSTGEGRPAITGRGQTAVWDFIPLRIANRETNHTAYPHLTVSIQERRLLVIVSVPNGISTKYRRNLVGLEIEKFRSLVCEVQQGVCGAIEKIDLAFPSMEVLQRHYRTQRSAPVNDARLEYDLRTAAPEPPSEVKCQVQWVDATYQALANKKSNIQIGIGATLPYGSEALRSRRVLDTIAKTWIACQPWLQRILRGK